MSGFQSSRWRMNIARPMASLLLSSEINSPKIVWEWATLCLVWMVRKLIGVFGKTNVKNYKENCHYQNTSSPIRNHSGLYERSQLRTFLRSPENSNKNHENNVTFRLIQGLIRISKTFKNLTSVGYIITYVLPKMAVFSDEQPLGLHLQFEPLNSLDHGLRCEQLARRTTEAV